MVRARVRPTVVGVGAASAPPPEGGRHEQRDGDGRGRHPDGHTGPIMNSDELRALPAVVDLRTAAAMLDIGRTAAYELVRTGQWPTPVLRLGRRIKVPTAPLLDLLGLSTGSRTAVPPTGEGE
jgi:hypothetical protein